MVISRTPLRMSFVGGGSDLPHFYRQFGGAVISSAVNKYVYITVNEKFDNAIRVSYSKTEEVSRVDEIEHSIARETLRHLQIDGGVEITSIADIPARGTGLGSSSAFTVGLLHALSVYNKSHVSAESLAKDSCKIELELCREPIGKQDQYASAYGGFNFIQFNEDESVFIDPIVCLRDTVDRLERNILVFYTGMTRNASNILKEQSEAMENDRSKQEIVKRMVGLTYKLKEELQKNQLDSFGEILHENWELKKRISDQISSLKIDDWYKKARDAGAIGGKLLGAGSGGFLMFYAPCEKHDHIAHSLPHLRRVNFRFEPQGSKIIFVY